MTPISCSLKLSEINLIDTALFYFSHEEPLITTTSLQDQYHASFTVHNTYVFHNIVTPTYKYSNIHLIITWVIFDINLMEKY